MIYDIRQELRDFTYITSVYKYIASYNLKGHQIGRKIGDMLEILTLGGIRKCPALCSHLDTEGKLEGFTTAGHKVEFGFYHNIENKTGLFGAIECKCVGVEETTSGKGQACLRRLHDQERFALEFHGRWMDEPIVETISLSSHTDTSAVLILKNKKEAAAQAVTISVGENIKIVVDENQNLMHTTPNGSMLKEIPGIIRICKTIKFDHISGDVCQFSLYNCLTGPQTIEKAKQASFVAMDLRKKIDGHWGKEELPEADKHMNFLHVICEFSHWEKKSRSVIETCIDHNIIVPDAVLIKAFQVFEEKFGAKHMLDMISKNKYMEKQEVQSAIENVFRHFDDHIFYDIALETYVQFDYCNKKLIVTPQKRAVHL